MTKRSLRLSLIGAAAAMTLAVTACSGSTTGPDGAEEAGDPVAGGTLTYAIETQPLGGGVDPMIGTALAAQTIMDQAYETLLTRDADGEIQPGLALEYEQPDDLTYIYTLREGVKFADGSDFTADDVVYTFEGYKDAQTSKKAYLGGFESVEAVDDYTVKFTFSEPNATFLNATAHRETFMIVGEEGYGNATAEERETRTFGTGPFQVTDWKDGVQITLSKNENYWQEGKPYLDTIEMPIITDDTTRLAALQQGTADAAWFADGNIADQAVNSGFTLGELAYTQTLPIFINPESGPLSDVRVRQAVSLAMDRQSLVDVSMLGYGDVSLVVPAGDPATPGADGDTPNYTRDVDAAKELLEEAGQPNPTIELSYFADVVQNQHPIYEQMQQQLAEAGITLKLKATPSSEMSPIFTAGETFTDLVSLPWSYRADPTFYFDPFLSESGAMNHWDGNADAEAAKKLLDEAKATSDPDAKADLIEQLTTEVAEQVLILVPMAVPAHFELWNSDTVHGYETDPYGSRYNLTNAWVTP
ncbi:MAG: ABC transporter substrate-binding protein [Microbacteriaceae bacterium]